ncbi:MAG: nucleotidyltransferase domain-containing protein [Prevotellaceae bacterium]|jgi:predicted nucleotidyltransferase|nr:nucleotidyltransferase domain-containing protein [Prevotellaceae bacterium]
MTQVTNIITKNLKKIAALCRNHKVSKLFAFGSVLTNRFNDKSDVDFVVEFEKIDLMNYVDNYFSLRNGLVLLLGREVDLLENKAIRNPVLKRNIDKSKHLIYG